MSKATVVIKLVGEDELYRALMRLGQAARGGIEPALREGAEVIRAEAESQAPGPHIEISDIEIAGNAAKIKIGPDKDHWYYQFFELGAQPHEIHPRYKTGKKALRFPGEDGEKLAWAVRHPGIPAKPFLRPAVDSKGQEAVEEARRALRKRILGWFR